MYKKKNQEKNTKNICFIYECFVILRRFRKYIVCDVNKELKFK